MKKLLCLSILSLAMVLVPVKKSEAIVGLAIASPVVLTVGGVIAGSGGALTALGMIVCANGGTGCGILSVPGILMALIGGIIVLDGNQNAEIAFSEVSVKSKLHAKYFSVQEIQTYNSELNELNAVRESVTAEVQADPNSNIPALWQEMGAALSPETLQVADFNGKLIVRSLSK